MSQPILRIESLSKTYGGVRAITDASLAIDAGERVGFIGPNGAGKSTLFKLIAGDVRPSTGKVHFSGKDVTNTPVHRRARLGIGRTFQITNLMPTLTLKENLELAAGRGPSSTLSEQVQSVAARFRISDLLLRPVGELAYGEQRRVELALAIASGATTLLLDEPAAGLGPEDRIVMREAIKNLPEGLTLLLIEHDIDLTLGLVDRVICLHYGEIVADDSSERIREHPVVRRIYLGEDAAPEAS